MSFEQNSVRKNLFLSACFCWDSGISLREMNQKFKFGGLLGYGISHLDSVFRYSKVFRLHAILHELLEQFNHIVANDLATATGLDEDHILA